MTSGDGRSVTYTAFDKPAQINRGTTYVRFAYGPDRARFRREDYTPIKGITTTHYVGGKAFERIITAAGAQTDKHYIGGFAVITHAGVGETAVVTTDYLHRDHLGSVEAISDTAGALVEQLSFDSWGRRRQGNWQPMTDAAIYNFDTQLTTRGFTGHEQLDPVGLVHMNGRVYDPTIGRFLSADPHVQAPGNLQNWNRYSYVMNNPLSYTDPTGFFFSKLFRSIGKAFGKVFSAIGSAFKKILRSPIVRSIIQIVGCAVTAAATAGFGCAAIAGALASAAGGSIADALKAAAFSFASMGAFTVAGGIVNGIVGTITAGAQLAADAVFAITTAVKAGVHGLVGGALAVAQGGNFLQGFIGSAAGAVGGQFAQGIFGGQYGTGDFGNVVGRAAVSAAAGCVGAIASGAKCANGAVTAAFASLYNGDSLLKGGAKFVMQRLAPLAVASKIQIVYLLRACAGCPVEYVGRTSGLGLPFDLAYKRWFSHTHSDLTQVEIENWAPAPTRRSRGYRAIRGREQQLIDYYGGAQRDVPGTQLRNIRRGVSRSNINARRYWNASNQRFGRLCRLQGVPC